MCPLDLHSRIDRATYTCYTDVLVFGQTPANSAGMLLAGRWLMVSLRCRYDATDIDNDTKTRTGTSEAVQ